MSLWKAIQHGKERRRRHHGSKALDRSCRNHGSCPRCQDDRLHQAHKATAAADQKLKDFREGIG